MGLDMYLHGRNSDGSYSDIAYWRKANQIHKWFVDNAQGGIDDCGHYPVTREQLQQLLEVCKKVISSVHLIDGNVYNGSHVGPDTNGEWVDEYIDGKVIEEAEIAEKLLPTQPGFFFGSTGYDQFYLEDVKDTIEQLEKALILEFPEFMYHASW